jgi:hypothetical protein
VCLRPIYAQGKIYQRVVGNLQKIYCWGHLKVYASWSLTRQVVHSAAATAPAINFTFGQSARGDKLFALWSCKQINCPGLDFKLNVRVCIRARVVILNLPTGVSVSRDALGWCAESACASDAIKWVREFISHACEESKFVSHQSAGREALVRTSAHAIQPRAHCINPCFTDHTRIYLAPQEHDTASEHDVIC